MTDKLQLELPLLLPEVTDASDACVRRLMANLGARAGIVDVHVLAGQGSEASRLCVHYDPQVLSLARIRRIVSTTGAKISERFGHALLQVDGALHERRARALEHRLRTLSGVLEVGASASGLVRVEFDRNDISEAAISEAISQFGLRPQNPSEQPPPSFATSTQRSRTDSDNELGVATADNEANSAREHDHVHPGLLGEKAELIFSISCGALLATGYLIGKLVPSTPEWLPIAIFIIAYVFGGFFTVREAAQNLLHKRFEIDTLMLVAATGAAVLGAWAEGALLLFLFSLGHALEHYAMGRAKRAIEALADLAPRTATVRRKGETRIIPVEVLAVGDVVLVRPNGRLPADGFLISGTTSVNQAPLTGESIPVDKRAVDDAAAARARPDTVPALSRVFAGTINGDGAIEIEVTHRASDTALARVVKMVSEAETQKSPTQRYTDKFERVFVPVVLSLAFCLLFAWVVVDEPFRDSFYRAMAVLVAASPCALAIATPSAVLSGVARAARGGVLIKGGRPLEDLGSLKAIAFDKTGTLTIGRPRITDVKPVEGVSKDELLEAAFAVESLSDHPLAEAITRDGRAMLGERNIVQATDLQNMAGRGVRAMLEGDPIWIGKAEMFGSEGIPALGNSLSETIAKLRQTGRTTMAVRRADRDLGAIGLMDTPRPAARETLERLRSLGISRMIMISGDHVNVAEAIAKEVGLDEAWGDLMPDDKVSAILKLRKEAKVAMVGDGVNDAPAMANATVGIAMGAAGSDVALETADVALMADDLAQLPFAVGLSRHTRSIILQNVFISLGVVVFLVPSTIVGLGIGPAVAMHEGSTLIVVLNALRLLAYQDRTAKKSVEGHQASA